MFISKGAFSHQCGSRCLRSLLTRPIQAGGGTRHSNGPSLWRGASRAVHPRRRAMRFERLASFSSQQERHTTRRQRPSFAARNLHLGGQQGFPSLLPTLRSVFCPAVGRGAPPESPSDPRLLLTYRASFVAFALLNLSVYIPRTWIWQLGVRH